MDLNALLPAVLDIARRAGREIMKIYETDFDVSRKDDRSPLTAADLAANTVIVAGLRAMQPQYPILSEESASVPYAERSRWNPYWLVDPLDGTKEFVSRNGEFTVNIALVEHGNPVLGLVLVPVDGTAYGAAGPGTARRWRGGGPPEAIAARRTPPEGLTVVHSRSHENNAALARYLADKRVAALRVSGSSVKFCLTAAGEADLYPRFGPTMEWDTAAGHAVLLAAGGSVETHDGAPLGYGKSGFANPGFIARGLR